MRSRFQFRLTDLLVVVTFCAVLMAFLREPAVGRRWLVVVTGLVVVWVAAGRFVPEHRPATRSERRRLLVLAILFFLAAVGVVAAIIVATSRPAARSDGPPWAGSFQNAPP